MRDHGTANRSGQGNATTRPEPVLREPPTPATLAAACAALRAVLGEPTGFELKGGGEVSGWELGCVTTRPDAPWSVCLGRVVFTEGGEWLGMAWAITNDHAATSTEILTSDPDEMVKWSRGVESPHGFAAVAAVAIAGYVHAPFLNADIEASEPRAA